MKKNLLISALAVPLLIVTGQICNLNAQTARNELTKGKSIQASLKAGEKHLYSLKLKSDQFAFVRLIQKGIDVTIIAYDPTGEKISEFDSPNGRIGPEPVTLVSGEKGIYSLEVRPTTAEEPDGDYDIELVKAEALGRTPEKQVDQLMTAWDIPGMPGAAVAVVKDGRIVFSKGYGYANLEYDIPVTPSTIFHIASLSKQVTAFAVLLLEKEGRLSLDDDIRKYIPDVPDFGKIITLRELAHHTSGLRDQWNLLGMAGWRLDDVITKDHILKLISRQKELNFNPNDEFLYCNTGFTLLAEVVARVSGKSFPEFTKERIFDPLGMHSTLFYDDHEKIVRNRAYSYQESETGFKKSVLSYANVGATSLFTTVEDLGLWTINFENPVAGDPEIIEEMNTRGILNNGDTIGYALGQDVGKYKGLKFISHGGADAGYRSFLGRFPDQRFSVVVFSNLGSFNAGGTALKIAEIYLKDYLPKPASKEVKAESQPAPEQGVPDVNLLKSYCGYFEVQPGMVVTITMDGGNLYAEAPGLAKTLLSPISASEFKVGGIDARINFIREQDETVGKAKITLEGQEITAQRLKDYKPAIFSLKDYAGDYYSPELNTTYTFIPQEGKILVRHQRNEDTYLTPLKMDSFSGNQWFFSYVEFVRDGWNDVSGCRVSCGRVRNLWFQKQPDEK